MTATGTARFVAPAPPPPDGQAARPPGGAGAAPFTTVATAVVRGSGLGLSTAAKLLYVVLRSYAAPDGTCFPGYERLQADVGCGVNQLTRAVRELEAAGLVTRRRRGQGRPTLYTVHAPSCTAPEPPQTHRWSESRLPAAGTLESPQRGAEQDSGDLDPGEQQHPAPPSSGGNDLADAGDDALLATLEAHGVTPRIARALVCAHGAETVREQLDWHPHRPKATNPAGALVQAIRERWPAPPAWAAAQQRAAVVVRQAEEEVQRQAEEARRRREWAAKPPEERIAGRLAFWVAGRRAKRHEPTAAELAAKRAELLAELAARGAAGPAEPVGCVGCEG
jgi:Helix-turn-helix domain